MRQMAVTVIAVAYARSQNKMHVYTCIHAFRAELVMGWVHPWVGLGQSFLIFGGLGWVGWRLDCVIFLTS